MAGLRRWPGRIDRVVQLSGPRGRWQIMRETFREGGRLFRLLVITDLSQALRDEERGALAAADPRDLARAQ